MNTWSSGYMSEIDYTYGYFPELNPINAAFGLTYAGYCLPSIQNACELGFGQGVSINIHACAQDTRWWGTDFNPSQAGFARDLSIRTENKATLEDSAFIEFCKRTDLPDFDFIALHGIWSWVSEENRQIIVDFIRKKLKVGGLLYISYNTLPGWTVATPLRNLMVEYVKSMTPSGHHIKDRIEEALAFCEKLFNINPGYVIENPAVKNRFNKMKADNRVYLAHEYINEHWLPMSFSEAHNFLSKGKLSYICSANLLDQIDALNLSIDHQSLLKTIQNPVFKQTVHDFILNNRFRKDFWIKGPRLLSSLDRVDALRRQNVLLLEKISDDPIKVISNVGEVTLQDSIYRPILDLLANNQPKTIAQLEAELSGKNISFDQLSEAIIVLVGYKKLVLTQDLKTVTRVRKITDKFNHEIKQRNRTHTDIQYLASPVTGGGIQVGRFEQLFLLAIESKKNTPEEWAVYVWEILDIQKQRIIKDGVKLESAEDNLKELINQAKLFETERLPILKVLEIA